MFFTIFDFRDATRLFADPDFDGPSEQDEAFTPGPNGELPPELDAPDAAPDNGDVTAPQDVPDPGDKPKPERRKKYYVHDVEVTVLKQRVQYIDNDGKLITESLTDYTRRNILSQYTTLSDFLAAWNNASRKQVILDALEERGVLMEELQEQIGREFDPFDLLCHIAYDQPPLTRRERVNNVKKRNYFTKYGEQAVAVLDALLEKYADSGISSLENLDILKVTPISEFGNPIQIVNGIFKGKDKFIGALRELTYGLYAA